MLHNYLTLWGLGGLIGKTKEVDMAYTRKHGVVRSLIKVLDIAHIPYQKDIFFEDEGYTLTFELEDNFMPIDGDDPTDGSGKDNGDGDDTGNREKKSNEEKSSHMAKEGSLNSDSQTNKRSGVINNTLGARSVLLHPSLSFGYFSNRWADLVKEEQVKDVVSSSACRNLFEETEEVHVSMPSKVFKEGSILEGPGPVSLATTENNIASPATKFSAVAAKCGDSAAPLSTHTINSATTEKTPTPSAATATVKSATAEKARIPSAATAKNTFLATAAPSSLAVVPPAAIVVSPIASAASPRAPFSNLKNIRRPEGSFVSSKACLSPSKEEIIAFGGIPEGAAAGIRSSDRICAQPNGDDTQMQRAMRLAQLCDQNGMSSEPKLSINSFSIDDIKSRTLKLGVSLGVLDSEIGKSINLLKNVETERNLVILERKINTCDEDPRNLFVSKVSGLCEDLTEEDSWGGDDHTDQSCQEVTITRKHNKTIVVEKKSLS
jgi:hypothetical protein